MIQKSSEKSSENYICYCCDYKTSRKSQYERHLLTQKHKNMINTYPGLTEKGQKGPTREFVCGCGKVYKHKQSLFKHAKNCEKFEKIEKNEKIQENRKNTMKN